MKIRLTLDSGRFHAGHDIGDNEAAEVYSDFSGIPIYRIREFMQGFDRLECYWRDMATDEIVGVLFLTEAEDLHYGNIAVPLALFAPTGNPEVVKAISKQIKRFCVRRGITHFQRSKWLDNDQQLLITKEVVKYGKR